MAKKKTKFPAGRELKSELMKGGNVSFSHYTTTPATVVTVRGALSETAKADLKAAIDEVLAFHLL